MSDNLDAVIERVRKANSSDCAYQHLLDSVADSIMRRFGSPWDQPSVRDIANYVRKWEPDNFGCRTTTTVGEKGDNHASK